MLRLHVSIMVSVYQQSIFFTGKTKVDPGNNMFCFVFLHGLCIYCMCVVYVNAAHIPYLYEGGEGAVCGVVCDEESHVLVAQFHRSRTIHGAQWDL